MVLWGTFSFIYCGCFLSFCTYYCLCVCFQPLICWWIYKHFFVNFIFAVNVFCIIQYWVCDYVFRGEGLFGACSLDFWGSWPGEDYEDYDDGDDFEYTHDEFWSSWFFVWISNKKIELHLGISCVECQAFHM